MSWVLRAGDLPDLSRGAAFLGTGGGGDPYVGQLMAAEAIHRHGELTMVSPEELDDGARVIPVSMMGAPSVMMEKIPSGAEAITALSSLERILGSRATHTMPVECGGINSMVPLAVAAARGIPVVDADGMGRAFPELQMETFTLFGVHGSPLVIGTERGEHIVIDTDADNKRMEDLARAMAIRLGGMALLASYSMTAAQVRQSAIPGTVSLALALGRVLKAAREDHRPLEGALDEALAGTVYGAPVHLVDGKVVDVERRTEGGFTIGVARLADDEGGVELRFQNENLLAERDGRVLAIAPDLICLVEADSYEPITSERLRYGQRVRVVAIPAPAIMRTPDGLRLFGPTAFGIDRHHTPIVGACAAAARHRTDRKRE